MCPDRATGYLYIMSLRRAWSVDTHKQAFVLDIPKTFPSFALETAVSAHCQST
jgi:hypothetical protein